jgi:phosphoribosylformylglycinamidine (FGAM) synthase-like enzyme
VMHELWGAPPLLNLAEEAALHKALAALAAKGLLVSAMDISDGGSAVAFAKACFPRELGVRVSMNVSESEPFALKERFFSETASSVIVSAEASCVEAIRTLLTEHPTVWMAPLGEVTTGNYECVINGKTVIDVPIISLKESWTGALEEQLASEVVTA